ncbi:MAG TPA: hypothetical protein VE288_10360 [Rubrobacteraceae bacterium]|nr:hypothetical protein [Rubrobacteraceae bacterium]
MSRDVPKDRGSLNTTPAPESGTTRAPRRTVEPASGRALRQHPYPVYWMITRNDNGPLEVLTTGLTSGEEALAVFSHQEEAEMFLKLWEVGFDCWQVRESTAGELISVLYGPCASVERVALDPLPEMVLERTVGLVSLSRERFVELVLSTTSTKRAVFSNECQEPRANP